MGDSLIHVDAPLFDLGQPGRQHVVALPYDRPPLRTNEMIGQPWQMFHGPKKDLSKATALVVKRARWPEMFRVQIGLVWYRGSMQWADPDNIAPTLKPVIDALKPPARGREWGAGVIREDHAGVVDATWQRVVLRDRDPEPDAGARLVLVVNEVK